MQWDKPGNILPQAWQKRPCRIRAAGAARGFGMAWESFSHSGGPALRANGPEGGGSETRAHAN
ncbi:MAG: hypothetical protein ACRYGK_06710, partial [Janthinobacterium lividum]